MDLSAYNPSQDHKELEQLLELVKDKQIKTVVEIGVDRGYSLEVWHAYFKPDILIGIEPEAENVNAEVLRVTEAFLLRGLSQDPKIFERVVDLTKGKIDFLFIDGDHHYEAVKNDFLQYGPLVKDGGVIVFHDAGLKNHPDVEVYKFWDEIKDKYDSKTILLQGTGYGVILK